jgi:cobalt-zinc-cadmium efflux system membrane fusion protein
LADRLGKMMSKRNGTEAGRRVRHRSGTPIQQALATVLLAVLVSSAFAHEGHDHDKPAPLNVPVAPRVLAVTPNYELVGVLSGAERLTIFVHRFETGEPVEGAQVSISTGNNEVEATRVEDGVFQASAAWLATDEPLDIVFKLRLPGDEDILTGRLERSAGAHAAGSASARDIGSLQPIPSLVVGALLAGILIALLASRIVRRQRRVDASIAETGTRIAPKPKRLERASALVSACVVGSLVCDHVGAEPATNVPSLPATMATDMPQRMPDGSLFVPKATQHLLSVRTVVTELSQAPRTIQLVGTITADPNSFGRVQTGHAGRVEAPEGGLPFLGKPVRKGDLLAFLQHHIEAYNKGNLQGEIAELEERIKLNESKLALYLKAPLAVPPIKIEETKGELAALRQKRRELVPTLTEHEEIRAPMSGVVSAANVVAGQVVDAREILFEIVDPARFWVEAITHDPDAASKIGKAFALLNTGEKMPLEFVGRGLALKQQAAPLTFRVSGQPPASLTIGKPVSVILHSGHEVSGIVVPAASIVRGTSGLPMVWVKSEPERFEPYTVRYEPLDGERVVILAGLKAELRVVTQGATLLNQIR